MRPTKIKLEINNKNIAGKFQNACVLNKKILNNTWVKEEISRHLKIFFNENITQNFWDTTEAV